MFDLIVHDFVSYFYIGSSCFTKTWSKRLQLHTERKWNIDRSHRWKEATFSNDPRWKIQRHTVKIYLLIFLWHFTNLGFLDDFPLIFHWFQGGNFCLDCHLMQLGTISFFSLLLLLHLLLCLQQWIAGNFLTEWRKGVNPLTCLFHIQQSTYSREFSSKMHDLHASKFYSIFFYRPRFTRFWHMNHTASLKLDLCSIGLGHSFALSLRKTIDKRCNSNWN